MTKVYIIGAKHSELEKIRLMANVPESSEIILVDSREEIPMEARSNPTSSIREIIPFTKLPDLIITDLHFEKQTYKRPYKFHR